MRKHLVAVLIGGSVAISLVGNPLLADQASAPPALLAKFVKPQDTLAAYHAGDIFGPGMPGAVLIVRHPIPDGAYEFDRNPCDLVVLKGEGESLVEFAKGTTTVDCVYNDLNKSAGLMALNDRVKIKPASIIFINQKDRGADRFYFSYSAKKAEWYLERVTTTFPGVDGITSEEATYPRDFGWTSLPNVSPEGLARALEKHKTVEK